MGLGGLSVPTPTLFDLEGAFDPERTTEFLRGLSDTGVDHLFLLGTLGEFTSLSDSERRGLLRAGSDALRSRTDLWVGVGAPATARAVAYAREAQAASAAALLAVPPYYLHPTEASILAYYRAIHSAVGLPLLAYNIPAKVGYSLSAALVHRLAADGAIVGMKDTSGSLESVAGFLRGAPAGFAVFPGDDALSSGAIALGAAGAVMGTANIAPRLALELVRSAGSADSGRTARLQELVDRVSAAVAQGPFPSSVKFLANAWRQAPDGYRAPYDPLT
ncbi:MAG TPA: dihydrodipicolinate synthase family protein, partial [Thermoplasmata archaeon]